MAKFGPEAYAPNGVLWWELETWPNSSMTYGDERRIAAYLACNFAVGDIFTTDQLRRALGTKGERNTAEHFQRRIRELRLDRDGWKITSWSDDRTLEREQYRLDFVGWHPGRGPRAKDPNKISKKLRNAILARDGSRCQVCGVGDGEPYPEAPDELAKMTIGHVVPGARGGKAVPGNLRVECSWCNEPKRSEGIDPPSADEMWTIVRSLKTADLRRLDSWLAQGHRGRDRVDEVYDTVRKLAPEHREELVRRVSDALGGKRGRA